MNILVTGGAGFIGSHVCEALLGKGHNICIYDNFNDYYNPQYKRNNIQNLPIEIVEEDICNASALDKCFSKHSFEAVIHLAAYAGVRPSIDKPSLYVDANLSGTTQILECMKKYEVKKLLFASSSSVYGNNEKAPFSEKDAVDNPISPYAATKKAGELLCYTYHHLYNINTACLRFFTVYGPRQRPDLAIRKFTEKIYANEPIPFYGDGSMGRDFTYIEDTVNGILLALDWVNNGTGKYEIFNLGESYPVSLSEMLKSIELATGKLAKVNRLPVPPGDVKLTYADISKAKNILGYNPCTSFDAGIEKFIEWFENFRTLNLS